MRQAVTRSVAHARGQKALGRLRQFALQGFGLTLLTTAATLVVALAVYGMWHARFEDVSVKLALLVAVLVGGRVPMLLLQGVLEGLGRFRSVSISLLGLNCVQLCLVLGGAWVGLDVFRILLLEAVVVWLGMLVLGSQVRRQVAAYPKPGWSPAISRETLIFGAPLVINALAGFLYSRVDIFFIRKYLEATDVADYFLMLNLFDFPLRALSSFIFVLGTDVARAHGAGQRAGILRMFYKAEGFGLVLGLGLFAVFFAASFLVPFVLPEYGGTSQLMRLMAPVLIIKCVAQVASGAFMVSLGRPRAMAALTLLGGITNVVLDVLLIPRFGTSGAVYSTLIGHTTMGVFGVLYVLAGVRSVAREEGATAGR